ncbi:MAG: TonB-dependent receptor plug domain-containing protein [Ignavibacteriaceae bacterium]
MEIPNLFYPVWKNLKNYNQRKTKLFLLIIILLALNSGYAMQKKETAAEHYTYTVFVYDASLFNPIHSAKVSLRKDGVLVSWHFTDAHGKTTFRSVAPGRYNLSVTFKEYDDFSDSILIDQNHSIDSVALQSSYTVTILNPVVVTGVRSLDVQTIQTKTGNQVFNSETFHAAPTARMTNLIQENVLGAVRSTTGEVHIRGQHGEFSYYLDGIQIPLGVFGGLNEVVDPKVVKGITFMTGGFPAEYGGQISAIMDIQTEIPSGHFHFDYSSYIGSYFVLNGTKPFSPGNEVPYGRSSNVPGDTLGGRVGPLRAINSNGQALSFSDHIGSLGYFISASRQETDHRIDIPTPVLYNDHGTDIFTYGKFDYLLPNDDYLTMNLNYGKTNTEVPFDINSQGMAPDQQESSNTFETLSYFHTISSKQDAEKKFFAGIILRQGGLTYTPSLISPVNFQFAGDSTNYALTEDRKFNTIGMRTTYEDRLSKDFMYETGFNFSSTTGSEHFTSRDSLDRTGPTVLTNYSGSDFGIFAEEEYQPLDWFRVDAGLRYDQHIAPDMPLQKQVSPRIKFNFFIDNQNNGYLYYGRLFMLTNIEGLRTIASNVTTSGTATLPEKDDFYEATYVHTFNNGFSAKTAAFYKFSSPGVDDQSIGSSAIKTSVNIAVIRTEGIELGISYTDPVIPFSGFLNTSIIHAYGSGAITGGFLSIDNAGPATDLDHDQRLSIVGELNYQPKDWFVNFTAIYGSGLTNGNPNNIQYGTGLFDFNTAAHVAPSTILNISGGYIFHFSGETTLEPSLYINNLLDHSYLLKGAFFSNASWGDRRNIVFKISLSL